MPISITPYAIPAGTAGTACGILPAGPFYAAISAGSAAAQSIFVGFSAQVQPGNGLFVPGGAAPVPIPGYPGQAGQALYAVAAQSGTVTATLLISQPG